MLTLAVCTLSPPLVAENEGKAEQRGGRKDDECENPGPACMEVLFTRQRRGCQGDACAESMMMFLMLRTLRFKVTKHKPPYPQNSTLSVDQG